MFPSHDRKLEEQNQAVILKKKLLKQVGLTVDLVSTIHNMLLQHKQQLLRILFVIHLELIIKVEMELERL